VKLLLDQPLSHRLVGALRVEFPGIEHVRNLGLSRAPDAEIRNYALENGYAIVSKDSDFYDLTTLYGHPPEAVWLRCGNCSTEHIEALLRENRVRIEAFGEDPESSFLIVE
jgi:predicted nuclease of predicted toxin-antitoxin system